jgi:hypothetical protein
LEYMHVLSVNRSTLNLLQIIEKIEKCFGTYPLSLQSYAWK